VKNRETYSSLGYLIWISELFKEKEKAMFEA